MIDLQAAQGSSRTRGIGRYARELALAMASRPGPHEVIVALNAGLPCDELRTAFAGVLPATSIAIWRGPRGIAATSGNVAGREAGAMLRARFLASLQPDILHVGSVFEGANDDVISHWPASLQRLPTAATCYDLIPLVRRGDYLDGPWRSVLAPWYLRHLHELAAADGLLAISEASRAEAVNELGYDPGRIANIRAGVAPSFAPPPPDAGTMDALYARYGLRAPFVLFIGAGDPRKNEAGLVHAFALLPPDLRDRHQLVIVGRTDVDALAVTARRAGLDPARLALVPFVAEADLPGLYAGCALFVLPSLHEGFGLPAAEAMACGAPTIASNCSSLPEVLGCDDALFDPTDPASIAARMQQVLRDPAIGEALRAHGYRQAARFTWQESARRAWEALETLYSQLPRLAPGGPATLPRLAYVSPLPPQESGIAAYSAGLVPALARHYDITLVNDRATCDDERLAHAFPILTPTAFLAEADRFDRVLYQVGNSAFHLTQLEQLLPAVPGVVTLHDAFLSNLLGWRASQINEARPFAETLLRAHGWPAVLRAHREGRDVALRHYPCSLAVVRAAMAVIQHSAHGRGVLAAHFGDAVAGQSRIIPLLCNDGPLLPRALARARLAIAADAFVVCSFGGVAPSKMPEAIVQAWAQGRQPTDRLVFVGDTTAQTAVIFDAAASDGPEATGWLDTPTYRLWLAAADIAVQLRRDSRGESSAAITDCLSAGLPTIVNAHGSAAELPDDVVLALPDESDTAALAGAIALLRHDPARRARLGEAARHYATIALAPAPIARRYAEAIEAAYGEGTSASRQAAVRAARRGGALSPAAALELARAISATFPTARPLQLLVATGPHGPAVPAALLRAWLADHPPALRVHPVTVTDGVLRQDWEGACRLLDIPSLPGEPDAAEIGSGDVLLVAAAPPAETAVLEDARCRGVTVVAFAAVADEVAPMAPATALAWLMAQTVPHTP